MKAFTGKQKSSVKASRRLQKSKWWNSIDNLTGENKTKIHNTVNSSRLRWDEQGVQLQCFQWRQNTKIIFLTLALSVPIPDEEKKLT